MAGDTSSDSDSSIAEVQNTTIPLPREILLAHVLPFLDSSSLAAFAKTSCESRYLANDPILQKALRIGVAFPPLEDEQVELDALGDRLEEVDALQNNRIYRGDDLRGHLLLFTCLLECKNYLFEAMKASNLDGVIRQFKFMEENSLLSTDRVIIDFFERWCGHITAPDFEDIYFSSFNRNNDNNKHIAFLNERNKLTSDLCIAVNEFSAQFRSLPVFNVFRRFVDSILIKADVENRLQPSEKDVIWGYRKFNRKFTQASFDDPQTLVHEGRRTFYRSTKKGLSSLACMLLFIFSGCALMVYYNKDNCPSNYDKPEWPVWFAVISILLALVFCCSAIGSLSDSRKLAGLYFRTSSDDERADVTKDDTVSERSPLVRSRV